MFDQDMYVSIACSGLQAVEHIAEILPEIHNWRLPAQKR